MTTTPTTLEQRLEAVQPVRVKNLPAFLAAVLPLAASMETGDWIAAAVAESDVMANRVIDATAIGAQVERAWLEDQDMATLIALAARVIEVNADFFVQRVLPMVEKASARIADALSVAASRAGSTTGLPSSPLQASGLHG